MNYAKLISSVITALTYGLEIGICIGDQFLELDEKGLFYPGTKKLTYKAK